MPTALTYYIPLQLQGRTENEITAFSNATPGMKAHLIRPGYFFPPKQFPEDRKHQRSTTAIVLDKVMTPLINVLSPSLYTPVEDLGLFALAVAKGKWTDKELFRNKDLRELVEQVKS